MDELFAAAVDEPVSRRAAVGPAVGIVRRRLVGEGAAGIDRRRRVTAATGLRITTTLTPAAIAQGRAASTSMPRQSSTPHTPGERRLRRAPGVAAAVARRAIR